MNKKEFENKDGKMINELESRWEGMESEENRREVEMRREMMSKERIEKMK
jgi:hypothetical protein